MARLQSTDKPLNVVERNLRQHFAHTNTSLRKALSKGDDIVIDETWSQNIVTAGLAGPGCERISRNRGGSDNITDILAVTPDLLAWLGYNEKWSFSGVVGGANTYSFRQISFTVYLGWRGDQIKPQLFRAEWAGFAEWTKGTSGFQAKNAGHPHWQFDALESVLTENGAEDAEAFLELLREESEEPAAKEFEPQPANDVILDVVRAQKLSRIHFASAAAWWVPETDRRHAHSPKNVQQLRDWSSNTLNYIIQELGRLRSK